MNSPHGAIRFLDASRNAFGIFKNRSTLAQLATHGLQPTSRPREADIIIGETRRQLQHLLVRGHWLKPYFLYTDEPGFEWTHVPTAWLVPGLKRFQVMNVFTGDVFTDATTFLPNFGLSQPVPELDENNLRARFREKRVAAFLTYRPAAETRRVVEGRNVDLNALRIRIALAGHARGQLDIFGGGFAPGIVKDSTGWGATAPGEEWWDVKHRMLTSRYIFNLCPENTDWPNYITEKIWQSIRADCLPIYAGRNNGVSTLFPADSYVEIADFSEPAALFDFLFSLSFEDILGRIRRCRQVYLQQLEFLHTGRSDTPDKRIDRIAQRIRDAVRKN